MGARRKPQDQGSRGRGLVDDDGPHLPVSGAASRESLTDFARRFRTPKGRIKIVAEIAYKALNDEPAETEQRNLALALRAVSVGADLVQKQQLPRQMKELTAQLQAEREERARMESGVEPADEGAELPPLSGNECH